MADLDTLACFHAFVIAQLNGGNAVALSAWRTVKSKRLHELARTSVTIDNAIDRMVSEVDRAIDAACRSDQISRNEAQAASVGALADAYLWLRDRELSQSAL